MKVILFTKEDTAGFNELQERIHLHLLSQVGVDGFHYSADCWADVEDAFVYENQLCLPIIEIPGQRYDYILEALTQEERDSIVNVTIDPEPPIE